MKVIVFYSNITPPPPPPPLIPSAIDDADPFFLRGA